MMQWRVSNGGLCVCVCACPSVMKGVTVKHALTSTSSPPNDILLHTLEPSSTVDGKQGIIEMKIDDLPSEFLLTLDYIATVHC